MPKTINPIQYNRVKKSLIECKSARQALKDAHYAPNTIRKSTSNKVVKVSMQEIMTEARKRGIIDKAWGVVEDDLDSKKFKHSIAGPLALKDMTEKRQVDANITSQKEKEIIRKYIDMNRLHTVL